MSETTVAVRVVCSDVTCEGEGVAACAECNGHGKVNPKGKRYRKACREIPAWAVDCTACYGTSMVACGCVPLDALTLATVQGRGAEYMATVELDAIEASRAADVIAAVAA